jgi:hypothetical protein
MTGFTDEVAAFQNLAFKSTDGKIWVRLQNRAFYKGFLFILVYHKGLKPV